MASKVKSSDPRLQAYSTVKQIGKGSYGEVFLVKQGTEKKQYVMKNIKLTASSAKERLAAEQEAVLLEQLKHPNIVSYKESFQDEHGVLHIVMGYCEGGDLCTRLKACKGQYLPETQVVEWFVQIALGLQYLHEHNILHRDLKTQNIFLSKNDIIKVGDLGIARVLDGSCDLAHTVIGTPYYMSPELFANEPYNHKSDIWALGCCVYEMATLKHAFTANNLNALMYKIIKGRTPALPSVFSSDLSGLVTDMMAHNAKNRPSVHQLLRNSFVRRHIKLFLDKASVKKKKVTHKPPVRVSSDGVRKRSSSTSTGCAESRTESQQSSIQQERATSLTDLCPQEHAIPEQNNSKQTAQEISEANKEPSLASGPAKQKRGSEMKARSQPKKPPRPLPPDPVSSPVVGHAVKRVSSGGSPKPNVSSGSSKPNVSSARERRRRSKLEGGVKGRVVLKSRSSSDLTKNNSAEDLNEGRKEQVKDVGSVEDLNNGRKEQVKDVSSADDLMEGQKQRVKDAEESKYESKEHAEDVTDGPKERLKDRVLSEDIGDSGSSHEVDDFLTLLDTTLHLPESVSRPEHIDGPSPQQAFIEETVSVPREVSQAMLQSGRLGDRIVALRRECLDGLGEQLMREASLILTQHEPEEAEDLLLRALGEEQFDKFAGKLQHLNFCQDNVRTTS